LKLQLVTGETYPTKRKLEGSGDGKSEQQVEDFQHLYRVVQELLKQRT